MINVNDGIIDVEAIFKSMDKAQNRMLGKLARAAKHCASATLRLSRDVYCPMDTGDLRASAKMKKTGPYHYQIIFGNDETWYAWRVHELFFKHRWPTKRKYLEDAIVDLQNGQSHVLGGIVSYQEIIDTVFNGNDPTSLYDDLSYE